MLLYFAYQILTKKLKPFRLIWIDLLSRPIFFCSGISPQHIRALAWLELMELMMVMTLFRTVLIFMRHMRMIHINVHQLAANTSWRFNSSATYFNSVSGLQQLIDWVSEGRFQSYSSGARRKRFKAPERILLFFFFLVQAPPTPQTNNLITGIICGDVQIWFLGNFRLKTHWSLYLAENS